MTTMKTMKMTQPTDAMRLLAIIGTGVLMAVLFWGLSSRDVRPAPQVAAGAEAAGAGAPGSSAQGLPHAPKAKDDGADGAPNGREVGDAPRPDNVSEFMRRLGMHGVDEHRRNRALEIRAALEERIGELERRHSTTKSVGLRREIEVRSFPAESRSAIDDYVAAMRALFETGVPDDVLFGDSFARSLMNGGLFEKRIVVTEKWQGNQLEGYEFVVETFLPSRDQAQGTTRVSGTVRSLQELWAADPALRFHYRP